MKELIERLEGLTGPNFEIEQEIGRLMNPNATRLSVFPAYTASIDAAMTLVPEGYVWSINTFAEPSRASAYLVRHDNCYVRTNEQFCATPAIALCIAALKAKP